MNSKVILLVLISNGLTKDFEAIKDIRLAK